MHSPADLSMLYQETSKRTLSLWRDAPGCGEVMQNDYYQKETFAPVTGIQPPLSDALHALVTAVDALAEGDPLADAMPLHGLHFTFLAIALPRYPRQQRPEKLASLLDIWKKYPARLTAITDLQLVALPGQLLLAGIPDPASIADRATLADSLLDSDWRQDIQARYANTAFPPPFWHSTLLRYRAQRLPEHWRAFFLARQQHRFGSVKAIRKLVMANYNWSQVEPLA
ncbi:hypothetical protein PO486_00190 [Atlantibacter hermannii]|uniref:hypothetical protein n=1 Tax=Enterobacteriaceae TaxID=543 RepID=UPI0025A18049|nr:MULTISPECIES: hypothetical protein [Enterobacteriaceae]